MSSRKHDKPTFLSWALDDDEVADAEQESILRGADTGSNVTSLIDILFPDASISIMQK